MFLLVLGAIVLSGCQIASMTTTTESPENQQCPVNCTEGNANTLSSLEANATACYVVCFEMKFQCPDSKTLLDLQVYENQDSSNYTACNESQDRSQNLSQQCQASNQNVCTIVICAGQICSMSVCPLIVHTCKPTDNSSTTTVGYTPTTTMTTSETQSVTSPVTSPTTSTQSTKATTTTTTTTTPPTTTAASTATTATTSPPTTTTTTESPTATTSTTARTQPPSAVTMTTTAARSSSSTATSTVGTKEKQTGGVVPLDIGVIVGAAVGGVVVMVIVILVIVCVVSRHKRRKKRNEKFADSLRVTYKPKGATATRAGPNGAASLIYDEPVHIESAPEDDQGEDYKRINFKGQTFTLEPGYSTFGNQELNSNDAHYAAVAVAGGDDVVSKTTTVEEKPSIDGGDPGGKESTYYHTPSVQATKTDPLVPTTATDHVYSNIGQAEAQARTDKPEETDAVYAVVVKPKKQ